MREEYTNDQHRTETEYQTITAALYEQSSFLLSPVQATYKQAESYESNENIRAALPFPLIFEGVIFGFSRSGRDPQNFSPTRPVYITLFANGG